MAHQPSYVRVEFGPGNQYHLELSLQALCDLGALVYGTHADQQYTVAWVGEVLHVLTPRLPGSKKGKRGPRTTAVPYVSKDGMQLRRVAKPGEPITLLWEAAAP